MKKITAILLMLICFVYSKSYAQLSQVNILTYNVKPVLPADVNDWATIPAAVILVVQPTNAQYAGQVKPVFTVKQGSSRVCGNTIGTSNPVSITPTHNFTTGEVVGALNTCPKLAAGNYTLCVIFYNEDNREVSKETCKDFRVEPATQQFCNPPQNISPKDGQIFTEKDFLSIKVFTWAPFISSIKTPITYRLTVWEVEDGQSAAQAMYDNFPVLQEDVKGITRYSSKPSTWERRNATYVWRVEALGQDGTPLCKTNISEPTQFKIVVPEAKVNQDSSQLNTPCGNGDFENGTLDPSEWTAGYTMLSGGTNSTFSPPFNNIMLPANGLPVDASISMSSGSQATENHHVIVSAGFDPNVPALRRTPLMAIPNNFALRLGNNKPGCGTERIQKKFLVTPGQTNYRFQYALVFEAPHTLTSNPSLWVRVFDASGTAISGLVYLDPLSTTPMDRAVSDLANPYWKKGGALLYRDWACAKIDLSSLVGQQVTIELLTNDCAFCGHYGYGYFDNFCLGCDAAPPKKDECCKDSIVSVSNTVTVAGSNLNVVQNFTVSPTNIKQINAEIAFVTETASDTSCRKCITNEAAVWNFMPINKAIWNSGVPNSGAPLSATGMYPAQNIVWFCNAQGNLKLDLKIALPGITTNTCKRKGKVGIRYKFTNTDCTTCEQFIIYDYSIN